MAALDAGDQTRIDNLIIAHDAAKAAMLTIIADSGAGVDQSAATIDVLTLTDSLSTFSNKVKVADTTESTSPTTGSGVLAGGLGVAKQIRVGGNVIATATGQNISNLFINNAGAFGAGQGTRSSAIEFTRDTSGGGATPMARIGGGNESEGTSGFGEFFIDVRNTTLQRALTIDRETDAIFNGDIDPAITETQDIGSVTLEWDNIFLQNSPTVSDKRKKNDLGSADPLIAVMKLLDPRIFSRKSKVVKESIPEQVLQKQKVEIVQEPHESIKIIDGVPTMMSRVVDIEKPVFKMVTVKDEKGVSVRDSNGKVVKHPVPVMEDYIVPAEDKIVVSHGRPHTGFMAQDVKQAMTNAGVDDWAGYAYHNDNGEDIHVLRLLEFIAPILAYTQELESRIEKLENN